MNKSESKYFNTALLMNKALLEILEKKDFEFITVTEICKKANVNRSTFYLHYETMSDLLDECLENAYNEFNRSFTFNELDIITRINNKQLDDLVFINRTYITPYLLFVKNNILLYKASYKNRLSVQANKRMNYMLDKIIIPIMDRFEIPKNEQKFLIRFYIDGTHAIIKEWILENCVTEVEEIEKIIIKCIKPNV